MSNLRNKMVYHISALACVGAYSSGHGGIFTHFCFAFFPSCFLFSCHRLFWVVLSLFRVLIPFFLFYFSRHYNASMIRETLKASGDEARAALRGAELRVGQALAAGDSAKRDAEASRGEV